ncbi:MAG: hypothetical protein R3F49_23950 [Planctomycetota bacterium]
MSCRRILLCGLAAAALDFSQGCHTSRRAPQHALVSAEAAAGALPVRLRNGPEHDRARAAVGEQIALLDREIERLATEVYPVTALLRQVDRVGLHTSLRFIPPVVKILRGSRTLLGDGAGMTGPADAGQKAQA